MSAIQADYRTNKHIPSRKCYQLILEVPEEDFPNVCNVLGYPKTGENVYVGIALLNCEAKIHNVKPDFTKEQTEGEKLRTRAVMLCKEPQFWEYVVYADRAFNVGYYPNEKGAREFIIDYCEIHSRSELSTNLYAQSLFRAILEKYKDWQVENNYSDNLSRI